MEVDKNNKKMSDKSMSERIGQIERVLSIEDKKQDAPERSLLDKLTGQNKTKVFKLPRKATLGHKGKLKKNHALIMWIRSNGNVDFNLAPIEDDFVYNKFSELWHSATADYILRYRQFPLMIIPEFSNVPYKIKEHAFDIEEKGLSSRAQKVLLDIEKQAALAGKRKVSGKMMLGILIAAAVVIYLLSQVLGGGGAA